MTGFPEDVVPLDHGWDSDTFMLSGTSGRDHSHDIQYPPVPGSQVSRDG